MDAEDCNDNGICKPESEGKGVCSCVVGFAGRNCEGEFRLHIMAVSPVVV